MAEGAADRSESPTPKRRDEARRKGQVVLSPEVSPVAVLLTALTVSAYGGPVLLAQSRVLLGAWLAAVGPAGATNDVLSATAPLLGRALLQMGSLLVPFFLAVAVVGVGAVVAQVGWAVNTELLLPDAKRLNPMNGLQRIFSSAGAVNLVKSILKIGIVLLLAYRVLRDAGPGVIAAPAMTPEESLAFAGSLLRRLLLVMAFALAFLGAADYLFQRWRHEQSLRMSRHEVKEEARESDGDPQVKGRFRRAHREIAKRRMLSEVKRADLVLTNPTHYAVALRYRAEEGAAPRVVAKGAGEVAQKIKEVARAAGVPIVERRALARALFRSVELGGEIPPALYRAVAEILAYIYSLRRPAAAEAR
jgi:flagellar biosynthetic protein FlhB